MSKRKHIARYWLMSSVFFAFIPFIIVALAGLVDGSGVNIERAIGEGELVLVAFLITVPSLVSNYRSKKDSSSPNSREKGERLYFVLLPLTIVQLSAYIIIRMSEQVSLVSVYAISAMSVALSLFVSWGNEKYLQEVENEHN